MVKGQIVFYLIGWELFYTLFFYQNIGAHCGVRQNSIPPPPNLNIEVQQEEKINRNATRKGPTRQQQSILELQRQNKEIKLKAEVDQAHRISSL